MNKPQSCQFEPGSNDAIFQNKNAVPHASYSQTSIGSNGCGISRAKAVVCIVIVALVHDTDTLGPLQGLWHPKAHNGFICQRKQHSITTSSIAIVQSTGRCFMAIFEFILQQNLLGSFSSFGKCDHGSCGCVPRG